MISTWNKQKASIFILLSSTFQPSLTESLPVAHSPYILAYRVQWVSPWLVYILYILYDLNGKYGTSGHTYYIILAMDLPTIYYKNCMVGKSIVQPKQVPPRSYIEAMDQLMYITINVESYSKCANTYLAIMKET